MSRDEPSSATASKRIWPTVTICVVVGSFLLLAFLYGIGLWPPAWLERCGQREKIAHRVQMAGGWDAIRRDCITLAGQHPNGFELFHETNGLSSSLIALRPRWVNYDPKHGRVRIKVFGIHRTGGPDEPAHFFDVFTTGKSTGQKTGIGGDGFTDQFSWTRRPVADGVDEIVGEIVY